MINLEVSFTLGEIIEYLNGDNIIPIPFEEDMDTFINYFNGFTSSNAPKLSYASRVKSWLDKDIAPSTTNKDIINALLNEVYANHYEDTAIYIPVKVAYGKDEEQVRQAIIEKATYKVFANILEVLEESVDRYMPLFILFKTHQDSTLIAPLTSSSESHVIFNDTPENSSSISAIYNDDHATNYTKTGSEASADKDIMINLLDEVRAKNISVIKEWASNFNGMFKANLYGEAEYEII